ncbi:MAG: nucleotide exchange factor GrpE [bacterium]
MEDQNQNQPTAEAPEPEVRECENCPEYLAKWKRALADYQNLQRQVGREKEEYAAYALWKVVGEFLPLFDHLSVALKAPPNSENYEAWVRGVALVGQQFEEALRELGVKKIETIGKIFDPAKHESVGSRSESEKEAGAILEEQSPGYEMNGRVLRPARVIINEENNI